MNTRVPQEQHDLRWPYVQPDEAGPQEGEGRHYGEHPSGPFEQGSYVQGRNGAASGPAGSAPDHQRDWATGPAAARGDDDDDLEWFKYLGGVGPAQAKRPPAVPGPRLAPPDRQEPQQRRRGKRKAAPRGDDKQPPAQAQSYADPRYGQRDRVDPGSGASGDTHPGYGTREHADPARGRADPVRGRADPAPRPAEDTHPGYGIRDYADPVGGAGSDTRPGYGTREHADQARGQREYPDASPRQGDYAGPARRQGDYADPARRQDQYPDAAYRPGEVTSPGHRRAPQAGSRTVRSARPDPATERGPASRSDREHDADGVAGDQRTPLPQQEKTAQPRTPVPSQPPRREQKALLKDQKALLKDQKALQKEQKARQKEQKKQAEPERRRPASAPPRQASAPPRQASAPPRQDMAVPGAPASKRAQPAAQRGRSSRRSRRLSSRKLLLLVAGAVVIVVGGVAFALRPVSSGPAHVLATPPKLGAYVQDQQLADGMDAASLKASIVAKSGGEAQHVVDAVYEETTGPGTASGPVIILFIGGNLSGASAESFITSFTGKLKGAVPTSPGTLGGDAACVPSVGGHPAECAWADNDTFGVIASPTLGAGGLASELRLMRPMVEHTAR